MNPQYRGFAEAGLEVVPPGTAGYDTLAREIASRVESLPSDDPAAVVLINQSGKAIAAWGLIYYLERQGDRPYTSCFLTGTGSIPSVLLPFGFTTEMRNYAHYWSVILPGSKTISQRRSHARR